MTIFRIEWTSQRGNPVLGYYDTDCGVSVFYNTSSVYRDRPWQGIMQISEANTWGLREIVDERPTGKTVTVVTGDEAGLVTRLVENDFRIKEVQKSMQPFLEAREEAGTSLCELLFKQPLSKP